MKLTVAKALPSLSRVKPITREPLRVGLVQTKWHEDAVEHQRVLADGVRLAAEAGAKIVFLQELTLSRYPADVRPTGTPNATAESLDDGPTYRFAAAAAAANNVHVHASLFEYEDLADGRGWNTAIIVNPAGQIVARTRKLHIPVTAGYYEDQYFTPGPADGEPYPVYEMDFDGVSANLGLPTCWDEWFPEVARNYSLRNAEILAYPTAIGSEPDHVEFDTEPLWRQVIVGNAIANGTFMVVPNRYGNEGAISFYGSSFICDPYGRILARADREGDEVLVADLDLDQRRDWLDLFPFLATRRPDTYEMLTEEVVNRRTESGDGEHGGIAGVSY
ncbi:MAG: hydrolase [Actinomycetales bacterium]|nr:hydrolase [Actinomycetales bacterium]